MVAQHASRQSVDGACVGVGDVIIIEVPSALKGRQHWMDLSIG